MLRLHSLWEDHSLSDVTIILRSHDEDSICIKCYPPSMQGTSNMATSTFAVPPPRRVCRAGCCIRRQNPALLQPQLSACESSFKLHAVVLSDASSYFKALFTSGFGGWCSECKVATQVLEGRELEAAEHVLKFIYTAELPVGRGLVRDDMLRLWMIQVADRWDVPSCMKACKEAICALSDSLFPVISMFSLPVTFCSNPVVTELATEAAARLLNIFGDALMNIRNTALQKSLCNLPVSAMSALLKSDSLTTDSEATVLLLLNYWYTSNCSTCSHEQLTELKALVRYSRLDPMFICSVLSKMPLFDVSLEQTRAIWTVSSARTTLNLHAVRTMGGVCPSGWFLPDRPVRIKHGKNLRLPLKVPQVKLLAHVAAVAKMRNGGTPPDDIVSTALHGSGYNWELVLSSRSCAEALSLCIEVFPPQSVVGIVGVEFVAKFTFANRRTKPTHKAVLFSGQQFRLTNIMRNAEVVLNGDGSIGPWQQFMVEGFLNFTVHITVLGNLAE